MKIGKSVDNKLIEVSEKFELLLEELLVKTLDDLLGNLDKIGVEIPKKRIVKKKPATKLSE